MKSPDQERAESLCDRLARMSSKDMPQPTIESEREHLHQLAPWDLDTIVTEFKPGMGSQMASSQTQ